MQAKKYKANVVGLSTHLEKHERQRLQLFPCEYPKVMLSSQENKRSDVKNAAKSSDGASNQTEERC